MGWNISTNRFTCHICGDKLKTKASLQCHIRDIHERVKIIQCHICE